MAAGEIAAIDGTLACVSKHRPPMGSMVAGTVQFPWRDDERTINGRLQFVITLEDGSVLTIHSQSICVSVPGRELLCFDEAGSGVGVFVEFSISLCPPPPPLSLPSLRCCGAV